MSKFNELFKSPHIHIALATGFSIIIMAYVSKKILPEPIGSVPLAIPPLLMFLYEALSGRNKNSRICTTWYWIAAIFISKALVIAIHMI
jgi:predicted histidine transporter YuiF (NhaC family)